MALPDMDKSNVAAMKRVKSLNFKQTGTFRMNNHWVPFTATQDFSALLNNLGFTWDATVFMAEPIPTYVSSAMHLDLAFFVQDTSYEERDCWKHTCWELCLLLILKIIQILMLENSCDG
jgi:hypothetical protein